MNKYPKFSQFRKQVLDVYKRQVMEIPPIKIDIKDFQVSTEFHNYKNLRDTLKNDILNLSEIGRAHV